MPDRIVRRGCAEPSRPPFVPSPPCWPRSPCSPRPSRGCRPRPRRGRSRSCTAARSRCAGAGKVTGKGIVRPGGRACQAAEAGEPLRVLVFSRTAGFRHASIADAKRVLRRAAGARRASTATLTEDPADLHRRRRSPASTSSCSSTPPATSSTTSSRPRSSASCSRGGGWVGVHSAADTEYAVALVRPAGRRLLHQPPAAAGRGRGDHRGRRRIRPPTHLPATFTFTDEIYNFDRNPRCDNAILLTIDEAGFIYPNFPARPSMGADHPVAWYKEFDGGRSFYTNLGHRPETWDDPRFQRAPARRHPLGGRAADVDRAILISRHAAQPDGAGRRARRPRVLRRAHRRGAHLEPGQRARHPRPRRSTSRHRRRERPARHRARSRLRAQRRSSTCSTARRLPAAADFDADALPYAARSARTCCRASRSRATARSTSTRARTCCACRASASAATRAARSPSLPDGTLFALGRRQHQPVRDADGFAPLDERPGRERYNSQRTAANPFDLRGKILRINPDGSIPRGNLFPPDGSRGPARDLRRWACATRSASPSIRETGRLFWGDVGPDAVGRRPRAVRAATTRSTSPTARATTAGRTASATNLPYNDVRLRDRASSARRSRATASCRQRSPTTTSTVTELALGNARGVDGELDRAAPRWPARWSRTPDGRAPFRLPDALRRHAPDDRLDARHHRRGRRRPRRASCSACAACCRSCASTGRSTSRSAPTARSTCSSTAPASAATTTTRSCCASSTRRTAT